MKKKGINFIVPLVLYPFDVMVSIGESDEDFQKAIIRYMPPSCLSDLQNDNSILKLGNTTDGRTINFETGHQTAIRIKKWPQSPRCNGILAHEIFHACTFVLWRMGIPFEIEKTDEVYAYLIDYVTTEVYKNVFK